MTLARICKIALVLVAAAAATATRARAGDWLLIPRYTAGTVDYTSVNQDRLLQGTVGGAIDGAGLELRWRPVRQGSKLWKPQFSLQTEAVQQIFTEQNFMNLQAKARFSYGTETFISESLRFAPMIQLSERQGLLIDLVDPTTARPGQVTRSGAGAGFQISYRIRAPLKGIGGNVKDWFELSGLGLWRYDLPAATPFYGTQLKGVTSVEVEGEATIWFAPSEFVQFRVRSNTDNYLWPSTNNSTVNNSSVQNLLLFDVGIGFRF
jgi:hypothetical protein